MARLDDGCAAVKDPISPAGTAKDRVGQPTSMLATAVPVAGRH